MLFNHPMAYSKLELWILQTTEIPVFGGYFFPPPHLRPNITSTNFKTLNLFHIVGRQWQKSFDPWSNFQSRLIEIEFLDQYL